MKIQMDSRLKIGLIFALLVAVAIFATFWVLVQNAPAFAPRGLPGTNFIPGDLEFFYAANSILSAVNIALLIVLTLSYVDIYVKTRSQFTIGLLIFALVFLVKDLTSSPLIVSLFRFRAYGLGPFEFLPGLFEFFALSVLLYLSVRY
jgi:hypothetical protein